MTDEQITSKSCDLHHSCLTRQLIYSRCLDIHCKISALHVFWVNLMLSPCCLPLVFLFQAMSLNQRLPVYSFREHWSLSFFQSWQWAYPWVDDFQLLCLVPRSSLLVGQWSHTLWHVLCFLSFFVTFETSSLAQRYLHMTFNCITIVLFPPVAAAHVLF